MARGNMGIGQVIGQRCPLCDFLNFIIIIIIIIIIIFLLSRRFHPHFTGLFKLHEYEFSQVK